MRFPFFKQIALAVGLIAAAAVSAETADDRFLEQATQMSQQYQSMVEQAAQAAQGQVEQYRDVVSQALQQTQKQQGIEPSKKPIPKNTTLIFASWSMGEATIRELVDVARNEPNVQIILRGVLPGETFMQAVMRLRPLLDNGSDKGGIVINPVLYRKFNVSSVPVMINTDEKGEQQSRITGVYDLAYFQEQIEVKGAGDFGVAGNVMDIAEPDMIAVLQAQLQNVKWDKKVARAKKRAWTNVPFLPLPAAVEDSQTDIDLSVMASQDITAPDGTIIVRKGTVFNPLHVRPFTHTLVIFNPTRKAEFEHVLKLKREGQLSKPVFMMTAMDTGRGWDRYQEILKELDDEVFILTKEIKDRFHIEVTPTIVRAKPGEPLVERLEIAVSDHSGDGQ